MLESDKSWDEWNNNRYSKGFNQGMRIGQLKYSVRIVRNLHKILKRYQRLIDNEKQLSEKEQKTFDEIVKYSQGEEESDIYAFIIKYPGLSDENLVKRILKESEYRHN